jgi:hypothetical protein
MKYLAHGSVPPNLPLSTGLLWWLALDHFGAPGWAFGALGLLWVILLFANAVRLWSGESISVDELLRRR